MEYMQARLALPEGETAELQQWLHLSGAGQLVEIESVQGGCINDSHLITTSTGNQFFLKTHG
ncbi:MAG: hypothetical protein MI864_18185, partial [Pseudomonadales bacterium]|nr:hypothetical protein [Pseudomonadales bacterium]